MEIDWLWFCLISSYFHLGGKVWTNHYYCCLYHIIYGLTLKYQSILHLITNIPSHTHTLCSIFLLYVLFCIWCYYYLFTLYDIIFPSHWGAESPGNLKMYVFGPLRNQSAWPLNQKHANMVRPDRPSVHQGVESSAIFTFMRHFRATAGGWHSLLSWKPGDAEVELIQLSTGCYVNKKLEGSDSATSTKLQRTSYCNTNTDPWPLTMIIHRSSEGWQLDPSSLLPTCQVSLSKLLNPYSLWCCVPSQSRHLW